MLRQIVLSDLAHVAATWIGGTYSASYNSNTHANNTKDYSQRPKLVPKFTTIISERHKIRYVHGRRSPENPQDAGRGRIFTSELKQKHCPINLSPPNQLSL
ncbi:hypothetical protein C8R41DRAFT_270690 [Lentinula lateritia]|uniref:Uncharacterized protein n=1 Tax=Lentinula lateritia TaxID=40482 RepID=A0ABQ8VJD9_9AGAR|nr:hypothetical protein C8R41DRAFT_270690 [Lentinula lateritia]